MAFGLQISSAASGLSVGLDQTLLRLAASVDVPVGIGAVGAVSTYVVPEYDDVRVFFTWVDVAIGGDLGVGAPTRRRHPLPFLAMFWGNSPKVLTVTHRYASTGPSPDFFRVLFLHYR